LHEACPSFLSVADLMTEVGHVGGSFQVRGRSRGYGGEYAPVTGGSQEERRRRKGRGKNIFGEKLKFLLRITNCF
jgi:hypothetical protein